MPSIGGWPSATDLLTLVPLALCGSTALVCAVLEWRASGSVSRRRLLALAPLLILGAALRFTWIDTRNIWEDEARTSLRVAGARLWEITPVMRAGMWLADLKKFERAAPGSLGSFLAHPTRHNPDVHPPLYFLLARLVASLFGDGVASARLLSAVLGLLAIPAAAWLGREISGSDSAAWLSAAAITVSPLQVVYSQEARMYSLVTLLALASSAALVRFLREGEARHARLYAALGGLGFLSHALFPLLLGGQALALLWWRRGPLRAHADAALRALLAGFACGLPWMLWVLAMGRALRGIAWLNSAPGFAYWVKAVLASLAMNVGSFKPETWLPAFAALCLAAALAELGRRRSAWGDMVAIPAASWVGAIAIADYARRTSMVENPRYLLTGAALGLVLAGVGLDALRSRLAGAGNVACALVLVVLASVSVTTSRSSELWFRPGRLTAAVLTAFNTTPPPVRVFLPMTLDSITAPELLVVAHETTQPIWLYSDAVEAASAPTFVWTHTQVAARVASRLPGRLTPIYPPLYRFKPAPAGEGR